MILPKKCEEKMKIAILSDIHANMEAFYAVIDYLRKVKIRKIMLLGDIIDYGPHSNEVIAYLNTLSLEILCNIRGNHEEAVIEQKYDMFSSERGKRCAENTRKLLNAESWHYLNTIMDSTALTEVVIEGKNA